MIMQRLDIAVLPFDRSRKLDLGSLWAGGATWLLSVSEDAEHVRRRGRWLNHRTMEIYIQEVSSLQFIHRLPRATQSKLFSSAQAFEEVCCRRQLWLGFLSSLWESELGAMGGISGWK